MLSTPQHIPADMHDMAILRQLEGGVQLAPCCAHAEETDLDCRKSCSSCRDLQRSNHGAYGCQFKKVAEKHGDATAKSKGCAL